MNETPFFEIFATLILLTGTSMQVVNVLKDDNTSHIVLSIIAFIVINALSYTYLFSLKRVLADQHTLYISNFLTEINIPKDAIANVTLVPFVRNPTPVRINFKRTSEFGK